ncbi:hypothetical protein M758_6G091900 [Ceratodon purpureus]|nr:hypothetical protein M758_6G091900 [Ceratodon purpureus]
MLTLLTGIFLTRLTNEEEKSTIQDELRQLCTHFFVGVPLQNYRFKFKHLKLASLSLWIWKMQEIIYVRPGARNAFRYWGAHYFVEFDFYWVTSYNSSLATHMGL